MGSVGALSLSVWYSFAFLLALVVLIGWFTYWFNFIFFMVSGMSAIGMWWGDEYVQCEWAWV
jgi:hypothetical protein